MAAFDRHALRATRSRRDGWRDTWRGYRTAARLGWRVEANWADPILFLTYSVAKPLAGALILVVMLEVVSGGGADEYRAFIVVGSALWSFVIAGLSGLAMSVLDDRERYRMLKYLYISPTSLAVLLLGRGTARFAMGGIGAAVTLAVGVLFLGVPFDPAVMDVPLLLASMALGLSGVIALGVVFAAVVLQTRQDSWSYPEAVAGALFLLVGAVFPLAVLPMPVQALGLVTPLTWWVAAVREALFPDAVSSIAGPGSLYTRLTGVTEPDRWVLLICLLATTVLVTLGAMLTFRVSERRAKDRGLIDQTTGT
ncbi:MAG: ABC transporter permease [Chloroflexi bacterium]|nr:ABC transporter permease [Chloroflexota bacterium]